MTAVELFQPATISTSIVLQALCSHLPYDRGPRSSVTHILVEAKTAQAVIQAAFEVVKLLHNNSVQGLAMVAHVANAALSHSDFSDHELLGDLCVSCILNSMQDSNFLLGFGQEFNAKSVVQALVKVPFTEGNPASDVRAAFKFLIETKGLTRPLPTQRTVMGQDMPMAELVQLLNRMAETHLPFWNFDLDAAINDIQASRN
ncbi:hypothetical protein C8J57DRAFT_1301641, partial [Mycena rebaudengoi]